MHAIVTEKFLRFTVPHTVDSGAPTVLEVIVDCVLRAQKVLLPVPHSMHVF